jgi:diacylglycerol kinase (ATP)
MYKRARIIYNPTAGRGQFRKYLPAMLDKMEKAGYETSCHATAEAGDATRAAQLASERRYDLIIAAGGDGTVNEVINGLAEKEYRPQVGIIPAGTTNVLARALGIPKDFEEACEVIIEGESTPIDVGKVNEHYFISVAGGGALTELTYEVPSRLKTILGQLAYYMKGVEKLAALQPTKMTIKSEEKLIDEEIMLFLVANSSSLGGFEKLAPQAKMNDGYFDVLVVSQVSMPEFLKLMTKVPRGEHVSDSHVTYFQTKALTVSSESKVWLNLDGEKKGQLPATFMVLPQHVLLRTPI